MAKSYKKSIEEMIQRADVHAEIAPGTIIDEDAPVDVIEIAEAPQTPEGYTRIRILSADHTDGKAKKTWLQNSVVEIDQYTAARMIAAGWAAPTAAPLNEMLAEYKGKR